MFCLHAVFREGGSSSKSEDSECSGVDPVLLLMVSVGAPIL